MTLGEVYEFFLNLTLEQYEYPVKFIEDDLLHDNFWDHIGTWRGMYDEPTVYSTPLENTARHVLKDLELALSGAPYAGFKGGDFIFYSDQRLRADDYGLTDGYIIEKITICEEIRSILVHKTLDTE